MTYTTYGTDPEASSLFWLSPFLVFCFRSPSLSCFPYFVLSCFVP